MTDQAKPQLSDLQRAFMVGVRYALRRASKASRRDIKNLTDYEAEIRTAQAQRQALAETDDDLESSGGHKKH